MYYFAYGSNLNLSDLNRWCDEKGESGNFLEFYSAAVLKDFRLAFTYHSKNRRGGVLDIVPEQGAETTGVLFKVLNEDGWRLLDMKEGVPERYQRTEINVETTDGELVTARSYAVSEHLRETFVKPSDHYVNVVLAGLKDWRLDDLQIRNALKG